jgi:acid phosphatase family membrane protein YuiD
MEQFKYLIAPSLALLLAQAIKIGIRYYKKIQVVSIFQSGGMPSSHTAFVVSLATIIGWNQGLKSIAFAIVAVMTTVVLFDSMNVRRTVGEYGDLIKQLVGQNNKQVVVQDIYYSKGHNGIEVTAGLILGIIIGTGVELIL